MRTIFAEAFVQFKINCLQELQVFFLINVLLHISHLRKTIGFDHNVFTDVFHCFIQE